MDTSTHQKGLSRLMTAGFACVVGGVCWYVWLRARQWLRLVTGHDLGLLAGAVLLCYFVSCLAVSKTYLVASTQRRTYACGISCFVFICVSQGVLLSDVLRLVLRLFLPAGTDSPLFLALGWCVAAFTLLATLLGIRQAWRVKPVTYRVPLPGLQGSCRLVLLSDLHVGYYVGPDHLRRVVEQVNRMQPDLVVIAGDMINAGNTLECPRLAEAEQVLAGLRSRLGTFAVLGNHDPDLHDPELQGFLQRSHIRLLEDEVHCTPQFALVGRTTRTKPRKALPQLLEGLPAALPRIVVDHDPLGIREASSQNVQLVLCGHTHKGQVFPLNLVCRLLYSKEEFWGLGQVGSTRTIVSAGAGYFSMPMRLGSSCEVVCAELTPG